MITAEINLNALSHNLEVIKTLSFGKQILAVVKANAYGHGIEIISEHLYKLGVRNFAVSSLIEANKIRDIVKSGDILILGITPTSFIGEVIENNYIQTIVSVEQALSYADYTGKIRCSPLRNNWQTDLPTAAPIRHHIKIDTGMTRFGISTAEELRSIMEIPGLKPEGLFTHLACADSSNESDREFVINQQTKFAEIARKYKISHGLKCHSQNSAGVLYYSDFEGDMVRAGIALYGYCAPSLPSGLYLKPVMSVKSMINQIREVGAGVPVSYGRTYITESPSRLAVIPVGYADGYSRLHSNKGKVVINGELAPIRGRVCMDYIIVDVTHIDDVKVGDCVEIYGNSHKEISIEHISESIGTIPYEVTCAVSERVKRMVKDL
jgi:alanine racemase